MTINAEKLRGLALEEKTAHIYQTDIFSSNIYLLKLCNSKTRERCKTCSKLTIKAHK